MKQAASTTHPFAQLGYDFMGACFEVHRALGGGLLEEIYQESLELELMMRQIPFASKQELVVYYKEHQFNKRYVPDFVVAKHTVVEIKAVESLCEKHEGSFSITCGSHGSLLAIWLTLRLSRKSNGSDSRYPNTWTPIVRHFSASLASISG